METNHHTKVILLGIFILVALILLVLLRIFFPGSLPQLSYNAQGTPKPTVKMQSPHGSFMLTSTTAVATGEDMVVAVNAESEGREVISYDAIISYDPTVLKYKNATSSVSQYKMYPYAQDGVVILTAANDGKATALTGKIAQVTFEAIKPGAATLKIVKTYKQATSGMLSTKGEDMLKEVNEVTVTVTK